MFIFYEKTQFFIFLITLCMVANAGAKDCFEKAGRDSQIDPDLLRAIAKVESNSDHLAIGRNPYKGFGVGIMQIDSQHFNYLQRFGIHPEQLLDRCLNIYTGAYFLKLALNRTESIWEGVGAYNAGFLKSQVQSQRRKKYANKVRYQYQSIKNNRKRIN